MKNRLQIGEKVGEYQIVGFLGAGGMGSVYQGVHSKINRAAAIKVLASAGKDSTNARRFFNEARLQSSLQHSNIATLYDFQETAERLFIVMEYVDGETLENLIKRRYFSVEDALKTFESICEAVAFIHGNDIIHRDIKPQNIKLTSTGKIKLLDFGIAKDSFSQGLTRIGGVIGTPHYLAPEQLSGQKASPRSDIWSLGILFYEMLTGAEPFKGNTLFDLHQQITAGEYEEPQKLNSAVTLEVSQIIEKCLRKTPDERYRNVEKLLTDLRRALSRYKPPPIPAENLQKERTSQSNRSESKSKEKDVPTEPDLVASDSEVKKRPFVWIAAGVALLLFGIIGVSIWAMSDDGAVNTANSNLIVVSPVNASTPKVSISKNTGQPAPQQSGGSKSNTVRVLVDTNEGTADIYRDGERIGKTPFEVEGSEGESVNLTLKRNGYLDQQVQLEIAARRRVYTFVLQRK